MKYNEKDRGHICSLSNILIKKGENSIQKRLGLGAVRAKNLGWLVGTKLSNLRKWED